MGGREDSSRQFPLWRAFRWLTGFHGLPYLARSTFRYEQAGIIANSFALSVTVGGFCLFFAKKGFEVSDWMLAALAASPAAGSFAGAVLTGTLRRWRQPTVISGCMFGAAAMTAMVVLLPVAPAYAPVFTALMIAANSLTMVAFQARVAIWQANYPAGMRGGIVSRNFIVQTALIAVLAPAAGGLLDWRPSLYRWIYLAAAASFVVSGLFLGRIRVRGEALRLRRDSQARPSMDPLAIVRVFSRDRSFAKYMALQMLLGIVTLAVIPIVPKLLKEVFNASYVQGNIALTAVPLAAQIVMLPVLGRVFDRISIFRFRTFGSAVWGLSRLVLAAGVALVAMPLVILSALFSGVGQTFGGLAWSAGHLDFAKPQDAHLYMGAHMMLTGLRGLTVPFLGMWLYGRVMGIHIIWVTAVVQLVVAAVFWRVDPHRPAPSVDAMPSSTYVP